MQQHTIFEPYQLGDIQLTSRIAMAPLTRCRAVDSNTPNPLMAEYYGQRASAGLIIAEGTSPSPNGLGYTNIPGAYNELQAEAWKASTQAVHDNGGRIFLQIMHTGRIAHANNLPEGAAVVGPSAIAQEGKISTYTEGRQPYPIPKALSTAEVQATIQEYVHSAKLCDQAGFDGIEIHCAHGYLPNQFLCPSRNQRTDQYGGSIENRCRFVLEIVEQCIKAIGANKVGIRISPFSYADSQDDPQLMVATYQYLAQQLNNLGVVFLHLSNMGEWNENKAAVWPSFRQLFKGTIIQCGDLDLNSAKELLDSQQVDMVAFGRDFIGNPDLVERFKNNWPITERNKEGWYGPDEKGYTDYAFYEAN